MMTTARSADRMMRSIFLLLAVFASVLSAEAAELFTLTATSLDKAPPPVGKEADWIYGDTLLRNDRIVAVVAAPRDDRHANMTVRNVGGCLIDLTLRDLPNDQLSCFYPGGGGHAYCFQAAEADGLVVADADQPLAMQANAVTLQLRTEAAASKPQVELTYTLRDGENFLEIVSVYRNPHAEPITVEVRDATRADRTFVSGSDPGRNAVWWDDSFFQQAYVLVPDGTEIVFDPKQTGKPRPGRAAVVYQVGKSGKVTLQPAAELTIRRKLVPARSLIAARAAAAAFAGESLQPVSFVVSDPNGPVAAAEVRLETSGQAYANGKTTGDGQLVAELPAAGDSWRYTVSAVGRGEVSGSLTAADLAAGRVAVSLPAPGYVVGRVTDSANQSIPCKVQFRPHAAPDFADPKARFADPDFGPDSTHTAVKNLVYSSLIPVRT